MHKHLQRISTRSMSHHAWLEQRRHSIGGSDAAAIVGLNTYSSPFYVWAEKTGRIQPKLDNETMRQGRDLEEYAAKRWSEKTGKKVRRVNAILYNPTYCFASANVDRMVVGENAGLECKTTSALSLKKFANGEFPDNYYVQCMHYMAVTGADRWYLSVVVLGRDYLDFVIERDESEIQDLMRREAAFWELVERDIPPPTDGTNATTEAMKLLYAQATEQDMVDLSDHEELVAAYFAHQAARDSEEKAMESIKQQFMQSMQGVQHARAGSFQIDWMAQTRRSFDTKAFIQDHPDIHLDDYYKVSSYRNFRIRSAG